jgi:hypothetical protein
MARDLGIQAESPPWAWFGGAARGPFRGLDARLRIMRSEHGPEWLAVSLAHSRPLNLGLHASPSRRPGVCDGCDLFARDRPLGTHEVVGYADVRERAEALLATPAVRAAFAALEAAEPTDRFAVHVTDNLVEVDLDPEEEPTRGLLAAMHALSRTLVSSTRLPDTPATPPLRRSLAARVLFILLAPPAFFLAVMALGMVGPWTAYALIVLGAAGLVWMLRCHLLS